ncbi:MAG: hypothetical protein PHG65_06960 [Kiritimatiellae bacterium]|nr:hypothetical protein [Kiritimatiellia bacterium]
MSRSDDIYGENKRTGFPKRRDGSSRKKIRVALTSTELAERLENGLPPTRVRRISRRRRSQSDRKRDNLRRAGLALMLFLFLVYAAFLIRSFHRASKETADAERSATNELKATAKHHIAPEEGFILEQLTTLKNQSQTANQQLALTYKLIEDGAWERALDQVDGVLETMPENMPARRLRAGIHAGMRQYDLAVQELLEVLAATPESWDAKLGLTGSLLAMKENEAALLLAEWMLEEQPYSVEARRAAASAGMSLGLYPQTILHLKKILEIDSENRDARQMLSLAYRRQGSYDRAIKLLMEQMAMDEQDSVVYYNLAVCYAAKNDPTTCLDWLRKAAGRFGHSFVGSWINASEFDPVRTNKDFAAFFSARGSEIKFAE